MVRSCEHHAQYVGELETNCRLHGVLESVKCSGCKEFKLKQQPVYAPTAITVQPTDSIIIPQPLCSHIGTKLSIAPCCGQLYSCTVHKGKKCATHGIAKDPFLSCSTCTDFELPDSWKVNKDRFKDRCVMLTSLNPSPYRVERQITCLQSWRDFGFSIIAVNTQKELNSLDSKLSSLVCSIPSPQGKSPYRNKTQTIHSMLQVGISLNLPFILLNSDVELYGDSNILEAAIGNNGDKLTIGVRYNHQPNQRNVAASIEKDGLDMFLLTTELAKTVPDIPFSIGKPVWDYWIPAHFKSLGVKFHWVKEPLLFHESHKLGWTASEWEIGSNLLREKYDLRLGYGSREFRHSLESW